MGIKIESDMTVGGTKVTIDGKDVTGDGLAAINFYAEESETYGEHTYPPVVSISLTRKAVAEDGSESTVNYRLRKEGANDAEEFNEEGFASAELQSDEDFKKQYKIFSQEIYDYMKTLPYEAQNNSLGLMVSLMGREIERLAKEDSETNPNSSVFGKMARKIFKK